MDCAADGSIPDNYDKYLFYIRFHCTATLVRCSHENTGHGLHCFLC